MTLIHKSTVLSVNQLLTEIHYNEGLERTRIAGGMHRCIRTEPLESQTQYIQPYTQLDPIVIDVYTL